MKDYRSGFAGEALAVEGANGAGKTCLLRLIAGFLTPRAGRILLTQTAVKATTPRNGGMPSAGSGIRMALSRN